MMDFPWVMLDYRRLILPEFQASTKNNNGYVFVCPVFSWESRRKKSTSTSPLLDSQLQCQILRAVQAFLEVVEVAKAVEESVACQLANKGLGWDPLPDIESNDFGGDWYPGWGKHPNFQIVSSIAFVLPQADGNS